MPSITNHRHDTLQAEAAARRRAVDDLTELLVYLGGPKFAAANSNWVSASEMYWKLADVRSRMAVHTSGDLPIINEDLDL